MKAYCVFCKTGLEDVVARNINKIVNNFEAVVPNKILQEKRKGKWKERKQLLLPGYVFLYGEHEMNSSLRDRIFNVYKILQYDNGSRELIGADYAYSMWLYNHNGNVATSKVLTEGSSVKVIDGPLLDGLGTIIRIDKHKRRAWIEIDFYGQKKVISLGIECISEVGENEISAYEKASLS